MLKKLQTSHLEVHLIKKKSPQILLKSVVLKENILEKN